MDGVYVTKLYQCARCGEDHFNLMFVEMANPVDDYKYYCMCPNGKGPILLMESKPKENEKEN